MKLKQLLILSLCTLSSSMFGQTKLVGGDLSLVPAYEAAGDVWLDANGNNIKTTYKDGMITYVRDVAKWNSVRVRLLVDPSQDAVPATCQDIEYVKKLGKRIKDAGMTFLLDIFYSDTWTDVSQQWIPTSWNMNRNTATETIAAKVKSYTTEAINTLTAYGAKPDYVQIGNEVSFGMLWDALATKNNSTWFFNNTTYQQAKVERFVTLLKAAAEGVRASNASTAKIVLHNERSGNSGMVTNFYNWVNQAGFTDYDVIGLSYYPLWHQNIANLRVTLNALEENFQSKKIQIVETGYHNASISVKQGEYDTSNTWHYTSAGQAAFLTDLITELNKHSNVDGLYYWQPEECGNGADDSGTNRVMNDWDQRGFWNRTWKSSEGPHALTSKDALMTLMTFIGETPDESGSEGTEVTDFENLDFENGTSNIVWTFVYTGWGDGPWPKTGERSNMVTGYAAQAWTSSASNLSAGNIIYQSKDNMPAGVYTITAVVHTDYEGIYLFANDDKISIPAVSPSEWNEAKTVSIQTTLTEPGTLTIGLTLPTKPTSTSEVNLYADNFKVTRTTTGVDNITTSVAKKQDNRWYNLSGQRINEPKTKGIYIINGKKIVK